MNKLWFSILMPLIMFSLFSNSVLAESNLDLDESKIVVESINNITIESLNSTGIEHLITKINESDKNYELRGDLIISSATLVSFFGLGSFLTIRLRGNTIWEQTKLLISVLILIFILITLHLVSIIFLLQHDLSETFGFVESYYHYVLIMTIVIIGAITFCVSTIVWFQFKSEDKRSIIHETKLEIKEKGRKNKGIGIQDSSQIKEYLTGITLDK